MEEEDHIHSTQLTALAAAAMAARLLPLQLFSLSLLFSSQSLYTLSQFDLYLMPLFIGMMVRHDP